jgi:hypothetical protein
MSSGADRAGLEGQLRRARAELERRLYAGEDCRAEEYFAACPALAADAERAKDLIYAEYRTRQDLGQRPDEEDYYRRFPQRRDELKRLFEFDREVCPPPADLVVRAGGPDGPPVRFQVLQELWDGPTGTVFKARDLGDNRVVAVKVFAGRDHDKQRFRTGAQQQASLRHDNILPVYTVGETEDGRPCFAMEFAEGGSLDRRVAEKPQPLGEAARLVRTLAEAMSYAHQEGVVHRDLKPANVVLTADEVPKVTDFGLARRQDAPGGPSQAGDIIGTPAYMAPEAAAGRVHQVGPLSDVYALGAILYELLTGRPPFQARTVVETLRQVLTQPPPRPRRLVKGVPPGLESICLKCLEKGPRRRYRSAQEMADDLGRWLDGKRPRAHGPVARAIRYVRRHPLRSTAAAVLVLAAVLAPLTVYATDPERQRERIEGELRAGREVLLIPEKGRPPWSQWVTGDGSQAAFLAADGSFGVECPKGLGMLELVRDPRHPRYRFSAWVHHDKVFIKEGEVGLYFAYSRHPAPNGVEHCFCTVSLNGLVDDTKEFPTLEANDVVVKVRRHAEPSLVHRGRSAGDPVRLPVPDPISAWRRISVVVSPEEIDFTVEWKERPSPPSGPGSTHLIAQILGAQGIAPAGAPMGPMVQVLAAAKVAESNAFALPSGSVWKSVSRKALRKEVMDAKESICRPFRPPGGSAGNGPLEVDPEFAPRSPMGLYVYWSSALVRDSVLVPLPGNN